MSVLFGLWEAVYIDPVQSADPLMPDHGAWSNNNRWRSWHSAGAQQAYLRNLASCKSAEDQLSLKLHLRIFATSHYVWESIKPKDTDTDKLCWCVSGLFLYAGHG